MNQRHSLVLVVALVAACQSKPKDETAPAVETAATAPVAAAPAATTATPVNVNAEQAALDELPVPADFEEQASSEITRENLDTQVAALEKEVNEN